MSQSSQPGWQYAVYGIETLVVGIGLGSWMLAYLSTHPLRWPVFRPRDLKDVLEDVQFSSRDGLRLSGWFLPANDARGGIVLCHGAFSHRSEMLFWARIFHRRGYHVLLFDFRARGRSEGQRCSLGYYEVQDLEGAIDYLLTRPEMAGLPAGVMGLSMGGAVALMTAAKDERIAAVATHGAYAQLNRAIAQHGRLFLGPLGPLFAVPTAWWGMQWLPIKPEKVSPREAIARIAPRPVLIMHGARDRIVRREDAELLYQAAGAPKEKLILPRSWHFRIYPSEQPGYAEILGAFFEKHLHPSRRCAGFQLPSSRLHGLSSI
ncbi:MAG TPA: alpha/beta fold hydrolase [Chthonomonadales bacterium]|nr:alpha/beta fold hydrolase [Chthonomonadales bacterium]